MAAVHHPVLGSLRTSIPAVLAQSMAPTTVVSDVGNLGLVIFQRLFTSRLKKNT